MNSDSLNAKSAKSIEEWLGMIFPHANADRGFDIEKASPEILAAKWAERAIEMLPDTSQSPVPQ